MVKYENIFCANNLQSNLNGANRKRGYTEKKDFFNLFSTKMRKRNGFAREF
jgi:hypothetical protein